MNVIRKYPFGVRRAGGPKYSIRLKKAPMTPEDRDHILIRLQQDVLNDRQNFRAFKTDEHNSFKTDINARFDAFAREQASQRADHERKHNELRDLILESKEEAALIRLIIAKWMGGGIVLLALGQVAISKFF